MAMINFYTFVGGFHIYPHPLATGNYKQMVVSCSHRAHTVASDWISS